MITIVSRSSKMIVVGVSLIVVITIITMIVWQRSLLVKQQPATPKTMQDTTGVVPPVVPVDPNAPPTVVVPPVLPAGTTDMAPTSVISPEEALKSRSTEMPTPVIPPLPTASTGSTGTTVVAPPVPVIPPTSTESQK